VPVSEPTSAAPRACRLQQNYALLLPSDATQSAHHTYTLLLLSDAVWSPRQVGGALKWNASKEERERAEEAKQAPAPPLPFDVTHATDCCIVPICRLQLHLSLLLCVSDGFFCAPPLTQMPGTEGRRQWQPSKRRLRTRELRPRPPPHSRRPEKRSCARASCRRVPCTPDADEGQDGSTDGSLRRGRDGGVARTRVTPSALYAG